jgi:hypothetical protein
VIRAVRLCLFVAACGLAGCNAEDTDRLTRVYRKLSDNFRDSTRPARDRLAGRLSSLPDLGNRVAARLHWDRALAGAAIEVEQQGEVIELRGAVADEDIRRRAVELAESTEGVEKVVDELTVEK